MELLIIFLLILLNGVFSMAEIALVSARKSRLESAAKKGSSKAKLALELSNAPNKFLSTVQIGITLIGILTGIYSGENITNQLQANVEKIESLAPYSNTIAIVVVLVCITFFSLVLGELLPKRIGLTNPEKIAKAVAQPMNIISKITAPFVWLLTSVTDGLIALLGIKPSTDSKVTEEEIKSIIQEGTTSGEVQEIEQDIMERVFNMGDRNVSSLMTHRQDVVLLDINFSPDRIREEVAKGVHSVYPVYENDKYEIEGYILLKDLFMHLQKPDFKIAEHMHQPHFISEHLSAYEALENFKKSRIHHAIVSDEYGQMQGLITMNDLLTALVGDVDEFYKEDYTLQQREDGSWIIDGDYPFYDFLNYFEVDDSNMQHTFNTVGGLIIHELKNIPSEKDTIVWQNLRLEVIDMDGARIDKIMITQVKEEE